jgi:50S ribosomal protein L16 3-hydroxylase
VQLDAGSRMLYDDRHVFINGEAFRAGGRDATLMRRLADERHLGARDCARLSDDAHDLLADWVAAGWLHGDCA